MNVMRPGVRTRFAVLAAAGAAALAMSCASPGTPPGGPPDKKPPVIVKVTPDSGATNVKAKSITVSFNEVVSERPRGGELSAVMVLSPSDGNARIDWNRSSITLRPRKAFHENTSYSLSIMPGLADLRGNQTTKGRTFVFSTGPTINRGVIRGAVFDWTTLKPATGALIEATTGKDTTFRWIARADSVGRYALPFLPSLSYSVRTILDANSNGKLEPSELWDTVTVNVTDSLKLDLYAFRHDTLGARLVGVDVKDSVTLRLTFDRPLALEPTLAAEQVDLRRADSTRILIKSITRAAIYDSLTRVRDAFVRDSTARADTSKEGRAAVARADSMKVLAQRDSIEAARLAARRSARDTLPKIIPPVPGRVAITAEFIAVLNEQVTPGAYRITARQAVSASRVVRTSERTFTRAKPAEKKPAASDKKGAEPAKPTPAPVKPPSGTHFAPR